jgi:hypothetical protein
LFRPEYNLASWLRSRLPGRGGFLGKVAVGRGKVAVGRGKVAVGRGKVAVGRGKDPLGKPCLAAGSFVVAAKCSTQQQEPEKIPPDPESPGCGRTGQQGQILKIADVIGSTFRAGSWEYILR